MAHCVVCLAVVIIVIIVVLCLLEQIHASTGANHADTFDDDNFDVKHEYFEVADSLPDDDSQKMADADGVAVDGAECRYRRSLVWKHFVQQTNGAMCKLCGKALKRTGSNTTNLIQHLKRDHHKPYAALMEETGRRLMDEATKYMV